MPSQPFRSVTPLGGKPVLINEAHVVRVEKGVGESAILHFSDQTELTILHPSYDEWENDFLHRKD